MLHKTLIFTNWVLFVKENRVWQLARHLWTCNDNYSWIFRNTN